MIIFCISLELSLKLAPPLPRIQSSNGENDIAREGLNIALSKVVHHYWPTVWKNVIFK